MTLTKEDEKLAVGAVWETETAKYCINYTKDNGSLTDLVVEVLIKKEVGSQEIVNSIGTIEYKDGVMSTHLWDLSKTPEIISEYNQIVAILTVKLWEAIFYVIPRHKI